MCVCVCVCVCAYPSSLTQSVCKTCLFSMLLYIIATEVFASLIDANKMIKRIQIGHHDTKNANFPDDTTIFLKDITCFTRMQVVLNLCIDGSSSKINLSKCQVLWTGQMK